MTEDEVILWSRLRQGRAEGLAFRRQVPLGPYVVDFLCRKAKLAIEVDGIHHGYEPQRAHDIRRDAWLNAQGYEVIRFKNPEIRKNLTETVNIIYKIADARLQSRFPPPSGGGAVSAAKGGGGTPSQIKAPSETRLVACPTSPAGEESGGEKPKREERKSLI